MASPHVHSSTATTTTSGGQFDPSIALPSQHNLNINLGGLQHQSFRPGPHFPFGQPQQPQQPPQQPHLQSADQLDTIGRRQHPQHPQRQDAHMDQLAASATGSIIPNISPAQPGHPHYPTSNSAQVTPSQVAMNIPVARAPPAPGNMNPIGGNLPYGMAMPTMAHFTRPASSQVTVNNSIPRTQIQNQNQLPPEFQPVFPGQPHPVPPHQPPTPVHNPMFNPNSTPSMQHSMPLGQHPVIQRIPPPQGPSSQPALNHNNPSSQPQPEGSRTPLMGSLSHPPPIAPAQRIQAGVHPQHAQHVQHPLSTSPPITRPPSHTNSQRGSVSIGSSSQMQAPYGQQGPGVPMQEIMHGSPQLQRQPSRQSFYHPGSHSIPTQSQHSKMISNSSVSVHSTSSSPMAMVMPNGRAQPSHSDYQGSPGRSQASHANSPRPQPSVNEENPPRSASLPAGTRPFNNNNGLPTGYLVSGQPQQIQNNIRQQSGNGQRPGFALQPPIGYGQALMFVLSFIGALDFESPNCHHLEYWNSVVKSFFHPQGSMRFTLWKDNAGKEAKPFDIGFRILPQFFYVTVQCGVIGMSISVDGATERMDATTQGSSPSSVVECKSASWTYRYKNGYTVVLRGPLVANVQLDPASNGSSPRYLIKAFNFNASNHERCISVDRIEGKRIKMPSHSPMNQVVLEEPIQFESATIPAAPVNAFGIPQMTMRCLELAESCELMSDLMEFSQERKMGPIDALRKLGEILRESHPQFAEFARQVASAPGGGFSQTGHFNSAISAPPGSFPMKPAPSPASTSSPIKTPAIAPALVTSTTSNDVKPVVTSAAPPAPTINTNAATNGKRKLSNADSPKRTKARGNQRLKAR